jgi:hypothetical protein
VVKRHETATWAAFRYEGSLQRNAVRRWQAMCEDVVVELDRRGISEVFDPGMDR